MNLRHNTQCARGEPIATLTHPVHEGDEVEIVQLGLRFRVHGVGERGNRLAARTVHWDAAAGEQIGDPADVIGVMMGGEDGAQFQPLALQVIQHGLRIAGIDHCGVMTVAQGPDVIVLECAQRNDFEIAGIGHRPSFRGSAEKVNLV